MPALPEHCRLNDSEHSHYYRLIVSELFSGNAPCEQPRAVMLGGQPGSGKTKVRELAMTESPSVVINADDLRDYHPMYKKLKLSEPERASFLVNEDVSMWTRKLIQQAVEEKRNIIFDSTFGSSDPNMIAATLSQFKENRYETHLWVLAVPAEFSKLGIYLRNEMQLMQTGSGRFVSMKVHDLNFNNIPVNIEMSVKNSLVDQVRIFSRLVEQVDDRIVNNNVNVMHIFEKTNADFKKVAEIFLQVRNKPLSAVLKNYFSIRYNEVLSMIDKRLNNALSINEIDKIETIIDYKNQFLVALGMNKNESKTIKIEL